MTTIDTRIIPYDAHQLLWHLSSNITNGMSDETISKIIEVCQKINAGEMELEDNIFPGAIVSVAEMLDDLKIDYNSPWDNFG